jgi:tetratricopeptide (TPR) repeat protein
MTTANSLVAYLRVDQRKRWQQGDPVPVEAYLQQHPVLATDPEAVVDLIWNEWLLRQEQGAAPSFPALQQRFRQYEGSLLARFQAPQTGIVSLSGIEHRVDPASAQQQLPEVPGYDLLAELGRGGMGIVYLARQKALGRLVALKMILDGSLADAKARDRFRNEAHAVARLQHPNIVQIHEIGEHEGRPFFSLEYVEGGNLQRAIGGVPQPEPAASRIIETLARAVQYTHEKGILHRDLKPTNILWTADGTPKITDFGLAKLQHGQGAQTRTEALIGTPSYMSPEQAAGNTRQIGPSADVYALGVILYELLTGRVPFQGTTLLQTLEKVRTHEPAPPRRFRGRVSRDLETICLHCLQKDPAQRYPSAAALAEDLRSFQEGLPIAARPAPGWQKAWRWTRRHRTLVASLLGTAALAGALIAFWLYFGVAEQLAGHRVAENYQKFLQRRNDAFFYGLVAAEQGQVFLGGDVVANRKTAVAAAQGALELAGVKTNGQTHAEPPPGNGREGQVTSDCYALLLLLADLRAREARAGEKAQPLLEEGLQLLERARELGRETQAYYARRADLLEHLGRKTQAKEARERGQTLTAQSALDHFLAGEEHYRRGAWEKARDAFDRALAVEPSHFWARFFLAVCHLQTQHWDAAKAGLNACLTQQPDFVWAYLFRSFANERLQAGPEAQADFDRALALNPGNHAGYVLFLTRGIRFFHQKNLVQAAADFRCAQKLLPDQYNAYLNLAQVYLAEKKFAEAERQMEKAMCLRPPVQVIAGYHLERARGFLRDKLYSESLVACAAVLKLSREYAQVYDVRGRALLALGHYAAAEESFDWYLLKGGETTADVFRGRGLARMKLARYPEAAEDYSRALERSPDAELYQHRGWAHFFADAWKLARRDFQKAIELEPQASDAHTGSALARVMLGQYREAVADADTAMRFRPSTPEMMHNLACAFALAAARAQTDRDAADRELLAETWRTKALKALRQTLTMIPQPERRSFWIDKIQPDPALVSLHGNPLFEQMQKEFQPTQE